MNRIFLILFGTVGIAVVSGCGGKSDETSPAKDVPPKKTSSLSEETERKTTRRIRNDYAEDRWLIDDDPSNEWEQKYEAAKTVDEKINVIGLKQSSGPEELAPMLRRALRHPSERLRLEAVQTTPIFINTKDDAVDIITGGVYDPSPEVRNLSMEMAREHMMDTKLEIYRNTIRAPDFEVRKMTAVELGRLTSKPAFEVLLEGLNDPDPEFRKALDLEFKILVNKNFASYAEARQWWADNESRYDDRMINIIE